jgi:hypothetical protein
MPKRKQKSEFEYPAERVWTAAFAAYRINNGYLKNPEIVDGKIVKPTNRELVKLYLADNSDQFIISKDREQGIRGRQDLINSVTMAALKNRATEWNLLTAKMAGLDTVTTDYEVSVITAMPKSHAQNSLRENIDSRLAYCESNPIGQLNERVETVGEVVRCNYSANYHANYVTVITDSNHQVFFAYRESLAVNQKITIRGRVKRHADRATQLSRVKIIKQEVL